MHRKIQFCGQHRSQNTRLAMARIEERMLFPNTDECRILLQNNVTKRDKDEMIRWSIMETKV